MAALWSTTKIVSDRINGRWTDELGSIKCPKSLDLSTMVSSD